MLTPSSPPREAASRPAHAIFKTPSCHLRVIYVMIAASDNQQSLVWMVAVTMEAKSSPETPERRHCKLVGETANGKSNRVLAQVCHKHLVWNRPHPAWPVFSWNSPPRGLSAAWMPVVGSFLCCWPQVLTSLGLTPNHVIEFYFPPGEFFC